MAQWQKKPVGDLPLYQAKVIAGLPRIVQGFTTRMGGVSAAPYESLNLGVHIGDSQENVKTNRQRVRDDLGFAENQIAMAEQIHGNRVAVVTADSGSVPIPGVDALVTDTPGILLMLFFADCVPIYLVDPTRRAIGLVHAGWRGAAANIAGKTVQTLTQTFDCQPGSLLAAIGPCIGGESYEVGPEVADQFRTMPGAGATNVVTPRSEFGGTYSLNLRQVIFTQLLSAGLRAQSIAVSNEDTFRNQRDFFSYRRDGITGRMAGFLGIQEKKSQ